MIDESILSLAYIFFLIFFGLVFLKILSSITKLFDLDSNLYSKKTDLRNKFFNKKNNNISQLVMSYEPFKWRIGLALSLASLDKNSEQKFLSSLSKVLKEEDFIIRNKNERALIRRILPPLQLHNKKLHKETSYYSDMYAVKSIIDGSSDTETLRFILELTIQDFVNKRTMPRSYSLKEFDPLENDDDSFDDENPF